MASETRTLRERVEARVYALLDCTRPDICAYGGRKPKHGTGCRAELREDVVDAVLDAVQEGEPVRPVKPPRVVAGVGFDNGNDPDCGVWLCVHSSAALTMSPPDRVCERGIRPRDHYGLLLDEQEVEERRKQEGEGKDAK